MRSLLPILFALFAVASLRADTIRERIPTDPNFKLYAVILAVTQNPDGSVRKVALSKVIEPATGTTEAVKIDVPAKFVEEAEKLIRARKYDVDTTKKDGIILPFATYYYYAPSLGPYPIEDIDSPNGVTR